MSCEQDLKQSWKRRLIWNISNGTSKEFSFFGEAVFAEALGIALQAAEHPKIIESVKAFMNQQIELDEKG